MMGAMSLRGASPRRGASSSRTPQLWLRWHQSQSGGNRVEALRDTLQKEEKQKQQLPSGRKLVVLSGKGGVGKSTVATQLAFSFAARGLRVGLLDVDVCGPSIPHMLGLRGHRVTQKPGTEEMQPVRVERDGMDLQVMSIGFLLGKETDAVVLRGPRKDAVIRQFISGVSWGALDVLLIDT